MICILHGYLLEGSGSNLWTREMIRALCRQGETVHLVCQENHPEVYDFITEAYRYHLNGTVEPWYRAERRQAGCCILHKPELGDTLPVYVRDRYEEFPEVVPMVELPDGEIETYLERNVRAVRSVMERHGVTTLHANHAVLMPVVAQRVSRATGLPFAVMPHGSAIEYAVKKDERFHRYAADAFREAGRVFVIGEEMRRRVLDVFPGVPGLEEKLVGLRLGVDTSLFEPVPRAGRPRKIAELAEGIAGLPRGRTPEQTAALRDGLSGGMGRAALAEAIRPAAEYEGKRPDAGLEEKLAGVDWTRDPTLLFVGRMIASKGPQAVVAALPLILERVPDARLLMVGHGPLREVLEALLWALEHGERALAETVVAHGRALEGAVEDLDAPGGLVTVRRFWEALEARGELDRYFELARRHLRSERVIFTGYLTHDRLRHLFPCCDVAVFPSVVAEAGPLVFLEALASGCFPLGTYFAGMRASIDSLVDTLPADALELMKLTPEDDRIAEEIAAQAPGALGLEGAHRDALRAVAEAKYDWRSVSRRFAMLLREMEA